MANNAQVGNMNNIHETPPAVQILPMNRLVDPEFKNYGGVGELQEKFFLRDLPRRQGKYYYRERGLPIVTIWVLSTKRIGMKDSRIL